MSVGLQQDGWQHTLTLAKTEIEHVAQEMKADGLDVSRLTNAVDEVERTISSIKMARNLECYGNTTGGGK